MPPDGMPDALVVAVDKETALESSQPSPCIQDERSQLYPSARPVVKFGGSVKGAR